MLSIVVNLDSAILYHHSNLDVKIERVHFVWTNGATARQRVYDRIEAASAYCHIFLALHQQNYGFEVLQRFMLGLLANLEYYHGLGSNISPSHTLGRRRGGSNVSLILVCCICDAFGGQRRCNFTATGHGTHKFYTAKYTDGNSIPRRPNWSLMRSERRIFPCGEDCAPSCTGPDCCLFYPNEH